MFTMQVQYQNHYGHKKAIKVKASTLQKLVTLAQANWDCFKEYGYKMLSARP